MVVEDLQVLLPGRTLRVRHYVPREHGWAEPMPALIYLHGGGFTIGSVDTHDRICRMLAAQADCVVLSVDYRLAPEHLRACVVRALEQTVAEGVVLRGLGIGHDAGQQAHHSVHECQRGQFATRHHEIPDRNLLIDFSVKEPLVDRLVAPAQ